MSYCVKCGVKLKEAANKCPLCETPVILAVEKTEPAELDVQPSRFDEPLNTFDKDLWLKLISVLTAAPALLTLSIDYFFGNGISWSVYVLFALTLVWVWCVSPFLFQRNIFPLWFAIDAAALIGFLYMIEITSQTGNWFLPLALPLALSFSIMVFSTVKLFRGKIIRQLRKPAILFFQTSLLCLLIEIVVDYYKNNQYQPGWSFLVAIPCIAFAVILLVLQRRQWIVEEIKHWFRI